MAQLLSDIIAERDKFRKHSEILNAIGYTVAVALGKVTAPEDYCGNVVADFGQFLELHEGVCRSDAAAARRRRDDAYEIDRLVALIRDLMIDPDVPRRFYPGGPCVWCWSIADGDEAHLPDCAWLRAKTLLDKADRHAEALDQMIEALRTPIPTSIFKENPMPEHDCADHFATMEVEPFRQVVLTLSADSPPILVKVRKPICGNRLVRLHDSFSCSLTEGHPGGHLDLSVKPGFTWGRPSGPYSHRVCGASTPDGVHHCSVFPHYVGLHCDTFTGHTWGGLADAPAANPPVDWHPVLTRSGKLFGLEYEQGVGLVDFGHVHRIGKMVRTGENGVTIGYPYDSVSGADYWFKTLNGQTPEQVDAFIAEANRLTFEMKHQAR